jgi:hypothetical protein
MNEEGIRVEEETADTKIALTKKHAAKHAASHTVHKKIKITSIHSD